MDISFVTVAGAEPKAKPECEFGLGHAGRRIVEAIDVKHHIWSRVGAGETISLSVIRAGKQFEAAVTPSVSSR